MSIKLALELAGDRSSALDREAKKNYAERLSRGLAQVFADSLRQHFSGIFPAADGSRHESRARTSKGFKKLDVNYSTPELGLGLGVSIKTVNFRDPRSDNYKKNLTRIDNELRAEASDYHDRQPYAVMIAIIFLPSDAVEDGTLNAASSFGKAVQLFRFRAGRTSPKDNAVLFERVFIGLYGNDAKTRGESAYFDATERPPKTGRPPAMLTFEDVISQIVQTYDQRNHPKYDWADAPPDDPDQVEAEPEENL
jgi:hypothetical protein